jgi:thiol:disulfide interchange protein DsbD
MIAAIVAALGAEAAPGQYGTKKSKPKVRAKVDLVSSVSTVVPGKPFDVALHFQLDRGWHIYWQNGGDAGLPPNVKWTLPEGFTSGDLQFPTPRRYVDAAKITSFIHDGDPVLLVRMEPPGTIDDDKVTLSAKVKYLICKKICIWGDAELRLELPVASPGSDVQPANARLFERARKAQPIRQSEYVTIKPTLSTSDLSPGKSFDFLVNVEVAKGYRIRSHEPAAPEPVNCDLFIERTPDIYFGKAIYPKPAFRVDKKLGKIGEYSGRFAIRIPGEVEAEEPFPAPPRFAGVFTYQACADNGDCASPEALAFPGDDYGLEAVSTGFALPGLLLACFLYGLFINATPCVLPVLSIKVLGFVQHAHESRRRTMILGLAFGAGVTLFFVILGLLAAQGKNVLQYPAAVIALGAVVMALALSMLGVYTLQAPTTATKLEASIHREGIVSSFGKGALAPVLGFACTGPLLAGAFGWATQQPPSIAIVAFVVAGFGMASPYMILGANPNWLSFLPKPGPWMITFERIMGFLLLAMVIWLLSPLVAQIGAEGLEWTLAFLVAIAMACWVLGKVDATMPAPLQWRYRGGATSLIVVAGIIIYGWIYPLDEAKARVLSERVAFSSTDSWSLGIPWRVWSPDEVEREVSSGKTVFVDITAAWCTVCKANKAMATNTKDVRDKFASLDVVPFQGDFTTTDPEIAALLRKHQRIGPPLNLIYPAGKPDDPFVLLPNLTKRYLLEKLDEAGPSRSVSPTALGS